MNPSDVPTDEETQGVAGTYPGAMTLSKSDWDAYWWKVEETLNYVFGAHDVARKAFANLKYSVEKSEDPLFQASIYHLDPFQVAADLADVQHVTVEQKNRYGHVLLKFGRDYDPKLLAEVTSDHIYREVPDDPLPHRKAS
ncbi:hypothetical protein [Labrys wisconsinensis]|uniref:Uncharacterized protein n=1 Tax=Labrys wisconsinensis TaxID=425677 RepID=A0ABU0J1X6_9HYPH|nr:hypothetical protein [Labrys wisconsinensis]MDQ0467640.1 hypothetical protein [Labrys wisconsinensis]